MKKIVLPLLFSVSFILNGCNELYQVVNTTSSNSVFNISEGLKQALEVGVSSGVDLLSKDGGYFKDQAVKILLPNELRQVDSALRKIGLTSLADEGLKILNKAAESAVNEAKPIFISAIKNMTINDAMGILKGDEVAATNYLKNSTFSSLETAFAPKIEASLSRVGADKIWNDIITQYNQIPFVKKVEPNLTSYVTHQAINGLFVKIGDKEKEIRTNIAARTTPLLKSVFALQDGSN